MREMKDSGLRWIDQIPIEWQTARIKGMFDFGKGLPITKENLTETGVRVISYGQIHSKKNNGIRLFEELYRFVPNTYLSTNPEALVKKGDFIFADTSEDFDGCGNCVYVNEQGLLFAGYHTIIFRSNHEQDNSYLAYLYRTDAWRSQIRERVTGVKLFSISRKILADCSVILPPTTMQSRIVAYLDCRCATIDALIANQQQQIDKLKQYKQAVITEAVTRGLDPNVRMRDSGVEWIGEVPEHWEIIPSKHLFANCDERRQHDDEQMAATQKYGVISQKEYMERENCRIVLADKGLENWKHVEPNDFVISLRSFQGGLEYCEKAGCVTWHYIVLRAKRRINYRYYRWLFKSPLYIQALQHTCNYIRDGQDLRYSNFVQVPLCIPPMVDQEAISNYLDIKCAQIDALIALKQQKADKLAQYKKSLIYEVVTGKREI